MAAVYYKISGSELLHPPRFRRTAITLPLVLLIICMTTRSYGNGWEHGAILYEALVKALEFESPEMRMRAAQSLGIRGQTEAVEPLLKCLTKPEEKPFVRSAVYIALGRLGDRRGIPVLTACPKEEMREELRSDCVTALGVMGADGALIPLLAALKEDSSSLY